jgi:hypothetical protein
MVGRPALAGVGGRHPAPGAEAGADAARSGAERRLRAAFEAGPGLPQGCLGASHAATIHCNCIGKRCRTTRLSPVHGECVNGAIIRMPSYGCHHVSLRVVLVYPVQQGHCGPMPCNGPSWQRPMLAGVQEHSRSTAGAQQEHSRSTAAAQQEHSSSTAGAQQEHSRSTAGAQQEHSSSTAGAQQEHSRSTAGAQQEHSSHLYTRALHVPRHISVGGPPDPAGPSHGLHRLVPGLGPAVTAPRPLPHSSRSRRATRPGSLRQPTTTQTPPLRVGALIAPPPVPGMTSTSSSCSVLVATSTSRRAGAASGHIAPARY